VPKLRIEGEMKEGIVATFQVTFEKEDGEVIVRDMTVAALCELLDAHTHDLRKSFPYEVPKELLSEEIERYRVFFNTDGEPERFEFVKILPPEKTGFLLFGKIPVVVPQPRRVILYSSDGEIKIFALKGSEKLKKGTLLYWYPLGHVEEDGGVCKGNVKMRAKDTTEAFLRIGDFFIAGTEGHYYVSGKTIKKEFSFAEMIDHLQKMDRFPEEWLQPAKSFRTGKKQLTFGDIW